MPIVVNVKSYCQDCGEFMPESESLEITTFGDIVHDKRKYLTNITCVHQQRCSEIYESIAEERNNEQRNSSI